MTVDLGAKGLGPPWIAFHFCFSHSGSNVITEGVECVRTHSGVVGFGEMSWWLTLTLGSKNRIRGKQIILMPENTFK
jgi:hypothetical protein